MATAENTRPIAGLDDLLGDCMHFQDPERARAAAQNVHLPVVRGICAIGDLLWWASQHEDFGKVDTTRQTIGDIGCLLQELGNLAHSANLIEANAGFQMGTQGRAEFVDVPVVTKAG